MTGGKVGVGLIGAGVISNQYLENLTAFPDLDVRFVADIDLERAKAQAEKYGVQGSGTVEELLADDAIEIVVNLTIPKVHVEVALQALAAGKHVWSEKPFALDRASGVQLLEAAHEKGLRVATPSAPRSPRSPCCRAPAPSRGTRTRTSCSRRAPARCSTSARTTSPPWCSCSDRSSV